ncbi:hypothetical protein MAM1_0498c10743 [Mucor ambiguus]|uniref:F-box domain-containing protein n=1 Tax=Mucor ambiguus TaxID=91626 RepID=A0A0C9LYN2_9FUNG|nr:hypothetical protein MAM1_0498c10743 [Mucor ambiguus]
MLLNLPAELLIHIIQEIEQVGDKCQLLQTCKHMNHLLSTHIACWKQLDLSPYDSTIGTNSLLTFLRNTNIPLYTTHKSSESITAALTALDLSGCWNLSEELVVALSRSLTHLTHLSLNGYRLNTPILRRSFRLKKSQQSMSPSIAFEQQRDHVYQVRPSHDLSSMAMDLSKKQTHRLKVPLILLSGMVSSLPHLTSLSIQYQDLGGRHPFLEFGHIRHLDISSCIISQPALQTLLRVVGPNLASLKMLNIDLNSLSWLSVSQYGKKLGCLHVSCNEPLLLPSIRHVVAHLPILKDFRLTRIRTGSLDPVIERLNPAILTRLDLSPKMNIYPRSTASSNLDHGRRGSGVQLSLDSAAATSLTPLAVAPNGRHNKHPPQSPKLPLFISNYATTEHDLLLSDASLERLSLCRQLVELRLCFPTITAPCLHETLKQLPQLQILELRQKHDKSTVDFLTGLKYCQHLKELLLFSVHMSQDAVNTLTSEGHLLKSTCKHITISDGGASIEDERNIDALLSMDALQILYGSEEDSTSSSSPSPSSTQQPSASETNSADESTQPVNEELNNSKNLFSTPPRISDITETVQVKLYCEVDQQFCGKVERSLKLAAASFAQVVNLKNKIVFQASYYSFCKTTCSNNTYGWGTPSSQFTLISLNEADSNFIYPQALAKQLTLFTDSSNWANYDVAIDLNHDMYMNAVNYDKVGDWNGMGIPPTGAYWFSNDKSIEDYQVDMEYLILHQMIHGLGMVSSWAPYFSDTNSPFQKLLKGLIAPEDSLKVMTPSPYWFVKHSTGPAYITGFQPNMIFDKFLNLIIPARNETKWLVDYSFDLQSFCVKENDAFIVNFMNSFLNNATQSARAKTIYVSMAQPKTLSFQFTANCEHSAYCADPYLNQTYPSIQLMTGPNILEDTNLTEEALYRPGISTSHVDDDYTGTPDFLMTHKFHRGKTLQQLVEEAYANIPEIKYNITQKIYVNVTTVHNTTVGNHTTSANVTSTEERNQTTQYIYKYAIGPGILRILETIGYSTVLTDTNYTTSVIKTKKPYTDCDDSNNNNYYARDDQQVTVSSKSDAAHLLSVPIYLHIFAFIISFYIL